MVYRYNMHGGEGAAEKWQTTASEFAAGPPIPGWSRPSGPSGRGSEAKVVGPRRLAELDKLVMRISKQAINQSINQYYPIPPWVLPNTRR